VVSAIRDALLRAGFRAATTGGGRTLEALRAGAVGPGRNGGSAPASIPRAETFAGWRAPLDTAIHADAGGFAEAAQAAFTAFAPSAESRPGPVGREPTEAPLGAARAQLHETYIVAQTADGIVIVDQHAAHERLVYERLKQERARAGIARQLLLVPEVVELDPLDADRLLAEADALAGLGLVVEPFGPGAVLVREVPSALAGGRIQTLVRDVADALAGGDAASPVGERLDAVLSRMSCHGSIRAGRRLKARGDERALRAMEATPVLGQCNHGRPTYVELKLADIERLFGRR
jgi:DNA mismatch repair protein MutL